jgi:hypothetical protein
MRRQRWELLSAFARYYTVRYDAATAGNHNCSSSEAELNVLPFANFEPTSTDRIPSDALQLLTSSQDERSLRVIISMPDPLNQ